jgi:hypothetical protein
MLTELKYISHLQDVLEDIKTKILKEVIMLSNRLKTALSKGIVFSYATIGSISMFL